MSNTTTPTAPTMSTAPVLTAMDRCDRCPAQAYAQYQHQVIATSGLGDTHGVPLSGQPAGLLLCAHHHREHKAALDQQGFVLTLDETHRLDSANAAFKGTDDQQ